MVRISTLACVFFVSLYNPAHANDPNLERCVLWTAWVTPPVGNERPAVSPTQYITIDIDETVIINGLLNATDPEGDQIIFRTMSISNNGIPEHFLSTYTCDPDGTITFTPPLGYESFDDPPILIGYGYNDVPPGAVDGEWYSNHGVSAAISITVEPSVSLLEIDINVLPGDIDNVINTCSRASTKIVQYGSMFFPVDEVNISSLVLISNNNNTLGRTGDFLCEIADVGSDDDDYGDPDGFDDLVCQFVTFRTDTDPDESSIITLLGNLVDDTVFKGVDTVDIVHDCPT